MTVALADKQVTSAVYPQGYIVLKFIWEQSYTQKKQVGALNKYNLFSSLFTSRGFQMFLEAKIAHFNTDGDK